MWVCHIETWASRQGLTAEGLECCAKVWKLHPTGNRSFKQMNTAIRLLPEWYMNRPNVVEDQGRSPVRRL